MDGCVERDVRLKEAAKEAETEIKKFREDKEAQYQANVQKVSGLGRRVGMSGF